MEVMNKYVLKKKKRLNALSKSSHLVFTMTCSIKRAYDLHFTDETVRVKTGAVPGLRSPSRAGHRTLVCLGHSLSIRSAL